MIDSYLIADPAITLPPEAWLAAVVFKETPLYVASVIGRPNEASVVQCRRAMRELSGRFVDANFREVVINNPVAALISAHNELTCSNTGDVIMFICRSDAVRDSLFSALELG